MVYYVVLVCLICTTVCALQPDANETDVDLQTTWSEETPGVILEVDKINSVTVTSIERGTTFLENCTCKEVQECLGNRTIIDPTCECREICLGQSGHACSSAQPCDVDFGLLCESGVCRGKLSVEIEDATSHSVRLKWRSSAAVTPQTSVWYSQVYDRTNTPWNEVKVYYNGGAKIEGLEADASYFVKVEVDGHSEIGVFQTKANPDDKEIRIIVRNRTASSLTLAWRHLTTKNQSNYLVEYRQTESLQGWERHQANGDDPTTSLLKLVPNTEYEIRVSALDKDGSAEEISDVIKASTKDGCVKDDVVYEVGQQFFQGCEQSCVCTGNNLIECQQRCKTPYHRAGTVKLSPNCEEKITDNDSCCARIYCKSGVPEFRPADLRKFCKLKDGSYSDGEFFNDGCDYKCKCTEGGVDCFQRCPFISKHDIPPGCDVITDPNDSCCKMIRCKEIVNSTTTKQRSSIKTTPSNKQDTSTNQSPRTPRIYKDDSSTEESATWHSDFQLKISEEYNNVHYGAKQFDHIKTANHTENKQTDLSKKDHQEIKMGQVNFRKLSGCEFKNQTYKLGEEFHDGCVAKCTCEGVGHISCVPRCPALSSTGETCHELPDPVDSCCTIMVCTPPGEKQVTDNLNNLNLKIEGIKARNASTIEIFFTLVGEKSETSEPKLQLWYSPLSSGAISWSKKTLSRNELIPVSKNKYKIEFGGLPSNTEYYFKIIKLMEGLEDGGDNDASSVEVMFSNTVSAKTFPEVVETSFEGCFHNNKTYEVGKIFYDGCQYKCVCHKEGQFECQDRCETYIDTVGFESCSWGPSNDDPCCIVPHCDNNTTALLNESFCLTDEGESHQAGDTWETTEGCTRKICKCVLLTNGTTRIECTGGCPPILPDARLPTQDCPHPELVSPTDPCECPYIICSSLQRIFMATEPTRKCEFQGKLYDVGKEFYDGCRALCQCGSDLKIGCAAIECPHHFPASMSECLEWDIDPNFMPSPPNCCPSDAKCKNDGSCLFKGMKFSNYKQIPSDMLECGTRCVCMNGNVSCESSCPKVEDFPPSDLSCPPSLAYKDHDEKNCCVKWKCHEIENKGKSPVIKPAWLVKRWASSLYINVQRPRMPIFSWTSVDYIDFPHPHNIHKHNTMENGIKQNVIIEGYCEYQGKRYSPSDRWEVTKGNLHRLCTCKVRSSGRMSVECSGGCPPIPARYREPTPQCARPVLVTPDDPAVCPYVVCNNSVSGRELQNVNIVSVNSTAVKVEFTLPSLFVGLTGHVELHYTTDPSLPPDIWNVEKSGESDHLFDSPNLEYYFNGLQPETTYYFQVKTVIVALQGGPESDLYKLKMPHAIPATTTTTLPPMVMIDASLSLAPVDPHALKVSWRAFEPQEKRFIDGIQLKYKPVNNKEPWKTTAMIHRDVTSHVVHNLEPETKYVVELLLKAAKDVPTKVVSLNTAEVMMPSLPKDDYDFQVSLRLDKTQADLTELDISGVPHPLAKYVHLAKVSFKSDTDGDASTVYKVPKTDKVILKELKPGRRYKVWLDLYLTNGKTLTSNVIEVTTKAAHQLYAISSKAVKAKLSSNMEEETKAYYVALIVVAVIAAGAGFGFILLLVILMKRQAVLKAPITRPPSQSAYDNPTFKPQDADKPDDKNSIHP